MSCWSRMIASLSTGDGALAGILRTGVVRVGLGQGNALRKRGHDTIIHACRSRRRCSPAVSHSVRGVPSSPSLTVVCIKLDVRAPPAVPCATHLGPFITCPPLPPASAPLDTPSIPRLPPPSPHPTTTTTMSTPTPVSPLAPALPKLTITYCTQCRWLLRAAYYAQELLTTFPAPALREVALRPATGGVFRVHLTLETTLEPPDKAAASMQAAMTGEMVAGEKKEEMETREVLLWDRKSEGGFPETKVLKQRVRDWVAPGRGLGHSDRGGKAGDGGKKEGEAEAEEKKEEDAKDAEECATCP